MVSSPNTYTQPMKGPRSRVDVILDPIDAALDENDVVMAGVEAPDLVMDALDNWVKSGVIPEEWVQDPLWAYPRQERLPLQPGQIGAVVTKITCGCDGQGE